MIVEILVVSGMVFLTIGVLGLLKLPETLQRMHSTSEATTLGVGFTSLATAIKFYPEGSFLSALLAVVFLFLTAPTGAHMIARAKAGEEIKDETRGNKGLNNFID